MTGIEPNRCTDSLQSGSSHHSYLALFIIARLLHGFAAQPLFTWGVTYLDDILPNKTFSFYVGKLFIVFVNKTFLFNVGKLFNLFI